ncbi:HlyD family efflux transporter periplasmic adaptor subunit [Pusillimonas sp. ANT_WB101]|uniref:HlyD family efflux transporter periplasmic adaptor subunit n=1 Tax=Pusillimonas sp. ANT_WB101 TaxID=2597356 RepID=UPI0011ECDBF9|nr:HlyD family efflux transporter periplasmic adaptor subunit [Pusillimonas sp. ANT_WB101]KAA0910701.1 HlyD family efflux transporter periplasmic adaptor subunit [Pusillimonas sp. ANT_WB101]
MSAAPKTAPKAARKPLLIIVTVTFLILGIAWGIWWLLVSAHYESTDNAYVHGNLVQLTSEIPGTVIAINADETQLVKQGERVIQLDPSDTKIAQSQAEAALAQAIRRTRTIFVQNDALEADIAMRQANIERATADLEKARSDLNRRQSLAKSGGVSGEEILHARTALKAAESGLAQTRAALAASKATLATNEALTANTTVERHPDVLMAEDKLRQAVLEQSRTSIPSPVTGMVAQRHTQLGQHVAPGTPIMTVVPLDHLWVEANFKESQLRQMKAGQNATLTADIYGDSVTYHGKIQGLGAGTGSAFALLPAQNASGNWIKVVQRVPVRISLDPKELADHPLRVGLSMQVKVKLDSPKQEAAIATTNNLGLSTDVYGNASKQADALIARIIAENSNSALVSAMDGNASQAKAHGND